MKMFKCDRCGKIYESVKKSYGITPFYTVNVVEYSIGEMPSFDKIDLCQKCQNELDQLIEVFMEKRNGD